MHVFTIEEVQKALVIAKQKIANSYGNAGLMYSRNGRYRIALEYHRKHLEIAEDLGDRRRLAAVQGDIGNTYMNIGEYEKALETYRQYLTVVEEMGNKRELRQAYSTVANVHISMREYEQAIEWCRKSLEIAAELRDEENERMAHGVTAEEYNSGQHALASDCHRRQRDIDDEMRDKAILGSAYGNLGNQYNNSRQYEKAIDCYHEVLKITEEFGDRPNVVKAHGAIGVALGNIGQYQKAIHYIRKQLEVAEELGDKKTIGEALNNMGSVIYEKIGQYQNAIDCSLKHLAIAKELGDQDAMQKALAALGIAYTDIGQYEMAVETHRKSLKISEELGNEEGVECSYGNLGNAYNKLLQYEKAIECHKKQLAIAEQRGFREGMGRAYNGIGNVYTNMGQYQEAIEYHRKNLEIAEEIGNKGRVGNAIANMGHAYRLIDDYAKAIECHRRHLTISQEIGDIHGEAMAYSNLGLCQQKDDDQSACSLFSKSILGFHSIRRSANYKDEFNTSISNKFAYEHKCLFESLLNLNQVKAALFVSESGKAKALYDLIRRSADVALDSRSEENYIVPMEAISQNPSSDIVEGFIDEVLSKFTEIMRDGSIICYAFDPRGDLHAWVVCQKGVFHKQWQPSNGMSAKAYVKSANNRMRETLMLTAPNNAGILQDLYDVRENFVDELVELPGVGEKDKRQRKFVQDLEKRIADLSKVEHPKKVLKDDTSNDLAVTRVKERYNLDSMDSCGTHSPFKKAKEKRHDKEKLMARYSLERASLFRCQPRMTSTHRGEPTDREKAAELYLRKQYSIFVSPIEEYLTGSKILVVPEGLLFKVPFSAFLDSKGDHMCDKYYLQFTSALHVLNSSLSKGPSPLGPALFVGNPTVGEVMFGDKVGFIPPLPNASVEVKECGKYFNAEPLLEKDATKENFLKKMKNASVIHLAAHGHMDHADIFLAPKEEAPKPPSEEHYLLTAKDIVDCSLKARLVVLSCCHSGRGKISAEGVVGIARSFLGAGARSVLVTLWQIPDKPTMEFMVLFYERVCQGLSVCVALQQAMLELKKIYPMQAWAPFEIVGEDVVLTQREIEEIRELSLIR